MKCQKCKKECLESELTNGYCYECRNKYKENEYNENNGDLNDIINKLSKENSYEANNHELSEVINKISKENHNEKLEYENDIENSTVEKINFIINATWTLGVISALVLGIFLITQENVLGGIVTMVVLPFATWLSTIVLESFKEIIVLLQEIKNK